MIRDLKQIYDHFILVDCGDMVDKNKTLPEERAAIMFETAAYMGYDALNVAEGDLDLGIRFLAEQYDAFKLPLISSCLGIPDRTDVIKPYVIKSFGDIKIGITGITSEDLFVTSIYQDTVRSSQGQIEMLKKVLQGLQDQVDFIILLSHLGFERTKDLIQSNHLTQVAVAVSGHDRYLTNTPVKIGQTLVVQNSMGGEYLSILSVELNETNTVIRHELNNIVLTEENAYEEPHVRIKMNAFDQAEARSRMSTRQIEKIKTREKERQEVLQLSPEEFLRKMKSNQYMHNMED